MVVTLSLQPTLEDREVGVTIGPLRHDFTVNETCKHLSLGEWRQEMKMVLRVVTEECCLVEVVELVAICQPGLEVLGIRLDNEGFVRAKYLLVRHNNKLAC